MQSERKRETDTEKHRYGVMYEILKNKKKKATDRKVDRWQSRE